MLALAVAGVPGLAVEPSELERAGPSYTVDTLRQLKAREPAEEFVLLLGADAAGELSSWREAEAIPGLARVVVFARPGMPVPGSPLIARSVQVPAVDISATEIRRRVREGRSIRGWVPDAVAGYVMAHGLYLSE